MKYILPIISALIFYLLAFFLGRGFRILIPKGKGFQVGSAITIGIMIIFFTIEFFVQSVQSDFFHAIGFGLAVGLGHSITASDRKNR